MLLQEDAPALDILRGVDAGALERCDDTVRLGLVLQVLHARLALQQLLGFGEVQVATLDALEDAVLLGFWRALIKGVPAKLVADVTARTSEARIKVLITILLCVAVAGCDDTMSALDQRTRTGWVTRARTNVRAVTKSHEITKV